MEETRKPSCQRIGVDSYKERTSCEKRSAAAGKPLTEALSQPIDYGM